jgi:hypothetical protein
MKLTVTMVDHAPAELDEQVPFTFELLRPIPGPKRSGYWLGALDRPLVRIIDNHERQIDHVVVWARWQGTQIGPGFKNLPIGIAYVTDPTQLDDANVSFEKCEYVAIGTAHETT